MRALGTFTLNHSQQRLLPLMGFLGIEVTCTTAIESV
jgi:hypothetical protein